MMTSSSTQDLIGCESQQHHPHPPGYGATNNAPPFSDGNTEQEQTLIEKLRHLKHKSTCRTDLVRNVILLIFGNFIWTVILIITLTVPVAMIIIGAVFLNDCPIQPPIPIIMIIMGSVMMLSNIMHLANRFHTVWDFTLPTQLTGLGIITGIINLFSLACFIAGCIWVYGVYQPSYHVASHSQYCNKTLYLFSFWVLTSVYIFFGTIFTLTLLGCLCAMCF